MFQPDLDLHLNKLNHKFLSLSGLLGAHDGNGEKRRMQEATASVLRNAYRRTHLSHLVALEISSIL